MAETRKLARCAIYTRKSTEHNLDLEFNSLDAQREACEAYIKSQAHEGWRLAPGRFDDGGLSGASLERPALQALLAEIEAGRIDVVVVYKVDRLTRSLTDFARLVELFDRQGVSFVSITQSFNTTTSMGRLTLNVLLSFAQFEREVIGERVRDKIAASKRKGLWMGGPVPLGYVSQDKKLVIVPDEAETVRTIFRRYLKLGAIGPLLQELDRLGIKTKQRKLANGRTMGGGRFGKGGLNHFLKNRVYIGEIEHRGEVHAGCHEPILDRATFDAVQAKLAGNAVERRLRLKSTLPALAGKIFDDRGNPMGPSHAVKRGVRYRYYVSKALLQRRPQEAGSVARVSAPDVEAMVEAAVQSHSGDVDEPLAGLSRIMVTSREIQVHLATGASGTPNSEVITVPWAPIRSPAVKGLASGQNMAVAADTRSRDAVLAAIAKARSWMDELLADQITIPGIAEREDKGERYIRMLLPLAFLAPNVVKAIADSSRPAEFTISKLTRQMCLWSAQATSV